MCRRDQEKRGWSAGHNEGVTLNEIRLERMLAEWRTINRQSDGMPLWIHESSL
jgi:hypothetical protein